MARNVLRLHRLERAHVVEQVRRLGLQQFLAHVARQVFIGQHVPVGRRIEEQRRLVAFRQFFQDAVGVLPQ